MQFDWPTVLLVLLTVIGAFGVSLCIGGLTLVYKAVSSLIGVVSFRFAIIDGANWRLLWLDGTWHGLTLQSMAFLCLGIILFRWGLKRARVGGTLGSY